MKAQLTIDMTPAQKIEISKFVLSNTAAGEPIFFVAEPHRMTSTFKIAMWHGPEAAAAQRILQAALDEAAALDNSG